MIQTIFEGRGRRSAVEGGVAAKIRAFIPEGMREVLVHNTNTEDGANQVRRLGDDGYEVIDLTGKLGSGELPPHTVVMVIPVPVWQDNKRLAESEARARVHAPVDFGASGVRDRDIRVTQDEHIEGRALSLQDLGSGSPGTTGVVATKGSGRAKP